MSDFFDFAFKYTIKNEGGFVNNPNDKGGPTKWGIIQREYSKYLGHWASLEEMKSMPIDHARDIYKKKYWASIKLHLIESENVAIALFDRAVLNGLRGVSNFVRKVLDKESKPLSQFYDCIDEVNATNPQAFVLRLADVCEAHHRARVESDPSQKVFLLGWTRRVEKMRNELGTIKNGGA